jgi:protease-4
VAKLGVNWASISTNDDASLFNPHQDYSVAAKAKLQASLDRIYVAFIDRVAKGRKLTPKALDSIAQGRVWTGAHAQKLGLVDHVGGMQTAIAVARQLAKISSRDRLALVVVPQPPTPFEQFKHVLQQTLGNGMPLLPSFLSLFGSSGRILAVY